MWLSLSLSWRQWKRRALDTKTGQLRWYWLYRETAIHILLGKSLFYSDRWLNPGQLIGCMETELEQGSKALHFSDFTTTCLMKRQISMWSKVNQNYPRRVKMVQVENLLSYCFARNLVVTSWSPFSEGEEEHPQAWGQLKKQIRLKGRIRPEEHVTDSTSVFI